MKFTFIIIVGKNSLKWQVACHGYLKNHQSYIEKLSFGQYVFWCQISGAGRSEGQGGGGGAIFRWATDWKGTFLDWKCTFLDWKGAFLTERAFFWNERVLLLIKRALLWTEMAVLMIIRSLRALLFGPLWPLFRYPCIRWYISRR